MNKRNSRPTNTSLPLMPSTNISNPATIQTTTSNTSAVSPLKPRRILKSRSTTTSTAWHSGRNTKTVMKECWPMLTSSPTTRFWPLNTEHTSISSTYLVRRPANTFSSTFWKVVFHLNHIETLPFYFKRSWNCLRQGCCWKGRQRRIRLRRNISSLQSSLHDSNGSLSPSFRLSCRQVFP